MPHCSRPPPCNRLARVTDRVPNLSRSPSRVLSSAKVFSAASEKGSSNCAAPQGSKLDTENPIRVMPRSLMSGPASSTSSRATDRRRSVDVVGRGTVRERVARV